MIRRPVRSFSLLGRALSIAMATGTLALIAACGSDTISGNGTAAGSATSSSSNAPTSEVPETTAPEPTTEAPTSGGGSGDKAACRTIQQTLTDVGKKAAQNVGNLAAVAKLYTDAARTIQQSANAAETAEIKTSGLQIAAIMNRLGQALGNAQPPSSADTKGLIEAGAKMGSACASAGAY
jgi:hypothetical protein